MDAKGGIGIDLADATLYFFNIACPVRVVGEMVVAFRMRHKTENSAGGVAYSCDIV